MPSAPAPAVRCAAALATSTTTSPMPSRSFEHDVAEQPLADDHVGAPLARSLPSTLPTKLSAGSAREPAVRLDQHVAALVRLACPC